MAEYRVTWTIDIEAATPLAAAQEALRIHRDPKSIATIFSVAKWSGRMMAKNMPIVSFTRPVEIDLSKEKL